VLLKAGELARVLPSRGQPGTLLALPPALVPVGVIRGQLMPPLAAGLAGVLGGNRPSAPPVLPTVSGRLPVCWVLAAAVLARPATAAVTAVVARVIHGLALLKRADELAEAVTVSAALLVEHPVPAPVHTPGPRPAVVRATLIDVGEVPLQFGNASAERSAPDACSLQLAVVGRAKPQGKRWLTAAVHVAGALGAVTGLKRIPVFAQLCVVGSAQPLGEHGPITVGTIRHGLSI
jgi:hypothetical protein